MAKSKKTPVNATKTSFEIIETLKELDGAGVSELAEHLGKPTTTVYDHLQTLEELSYIVKDGNDYRVGVKFMDLAGYARQQMDIYQVGKPEVQNLAEQTGEHVNLMIEEHGRGIFLYKAEGENAVHLDTYSGHRVYLQTTALGKAIMAHLPHDRVEDIIDEHGLPRITEHTITDRDDLFDELAEIRDRGYATDCEERVEGMRCVAAPIMKNGDVIGAVSVSGPKSRMQGDQFTEEIPEKVLRTANVIEVNLTYT